MDRKEETKLAKAALQVAGFEGATVKHGTGTSWGWLRIGLANPCAVDHYSAGTSRGDCPACQSAFKDREKALAVVKMATGRRGDYDGRINVSEV